MKPVTEVTNTAQPDLENQAKYDSFFTKDNIEISVQSIYRHMNLPGNADRMALITQLKEIAKARGYNVSESQSHFTNTKYIHFKKYRLHTEAKVEPVLAIKDKPKPEDIVVDAEEVRPRVSN